MSVVGRLKGGLKSGAGDAWTVTKKVALKVAIAAAIVVVAVALVERDEGTASEVDGPASSVEGRAVAAQPAILLDERADEQLMLCKYRVKATFGVSIFSDTEFRAKRLIRIHNGDEIYGSCLSTEGRETIGCAGLAWEKQWIRVHSGTTVGWSPASCLERIGFL